MKAYELLRNGMSAIARACDTAGIPYPVLVFPTWSAHMTAREMLPGHCDMVGRYSGIAIDFDGRSGNQMYRFVDEEIGA